MENRRVKNWYILEWTRAIDVKSIYLQLLYSPNILIARTVTRTICYQHFFILLVDFEIMFLKLYKTKNKILFIQT